MSVWHCESGPWGPMDPDCPADFTPCFEDTLKVLPVVFLLLAGIPRLMVLSKKDSLQNPWVWRQALKLLAVVALIVISTAIPAMSYLGTKQDRLGLESMSSALEIIALVLALTLTIEENKKSRLSSNVLLVYWLLLVVVSGIKLRTLTMGCPTSIIHQSILQHRVTPVTLLGGKVIDAILVFALECIPGDSGIRLDDDNLEKCPEEEANIFSIVSFHWVTGLMRKGYTNPLTMDDLWSLRRVDRSRSASDTFGTIWGREIRKDNPSLLRALAAAYGRPFYIAAIWKATSDILEFAQPLLLGELLRFVMSYKTEEPQPLYRGYTIAVLMLLCSLMHTAVMHQYYHSCFRCGMHVRAGLTTAIYQKSLRLSNSARQNSTVGEIVNHMSIDTQRLQNLVSYLHSSWSGLLQIGIALYLLYATMSWAIFAGVAIMLLVLPLNAKISVLMSRLQQQQMENKDARIRLMNELLNGIRVIKLYAWENTFMQRVMAIRNDQELKTMKKIGYLSAIDNFTWTCTPFLVSLSTFAVYVLVLKKPMTTDIVFPAISLFNLLQLPLGLFPDVISSSVEAYVSLRRIKAFLMSPEVDPDAVIVEDHRPLASQDASNKYTLLMKDATYSWNKDLAPVISDISLTLKSDALLSVIGRVGSGKSSLIAALCGDLERISGEIRVRGSIAFVPQQPWIMNDTLRGNILFGNPYDPTFYQKTVEACCLQRDFDMLPGGDMTEIGERGINLSGGQKARISLARAVYARADIYLFDDPLSAVDAHVGRNIFDNVIGPKGLLAGKTRVFVTHQIQYLAQSTCVMMLRDGKMVEYGDFQDLMEKKAEVYQLVTEFGNEPSHQPEFDEKDGMEPLVEQDTILEGDVVETDAFPAEEAPLLSSRAARRNSIRSITTVRTFRRQSTASLLHGIPEKPNVPRNTAIITQERMNQGSVHRGVYMAYANACSYRSVLIYIVAMFLSQVASALTSLWLTRWSKDSDTETGGKDHLYYIGVYAVLGFSSTFLTIFESIMLLVHCSLRSARVLHQKMLQSVLRSPMMFFDTTPMGRILNRFSKDQSMIDEVLPRSFSGFSYTLFQVASILAVVTLTTPSFIVVVIPFAFIYYWIQKYYLATSREVRRLESVTRSPIFAYFQETLGGITTIRAYRQQARFIQGNEHRLDQNLRAYYPGIAGNRWLALRLEALSSVIIFGAALLSVVSLARKIDVDPGLVGLSLTYALNITQMLNWMVRQYTEIESNIVSVERVQEYIELTPEAPETIEEHRPPEEWPPRGRVEFMNYETRYRPGLDLVLRGINCLIQPHEKIGICGRTGAGKSSLTLALFRIVEAASGQIVVDGIDISSIGLHDLRSRLSIIPQDPVLFAGTIRFNLDPLGTKSDTELWQALEDSNLKTSISNMGGGLQATVLEGGENFSMGQRQLICLARALLRKTSLLVLDEATAAIDLETDALVQKIIRQKFSDCTILTIAHRINTVMDSDRIMVLDQGRIVEFDSPENLTKDRNSVFYSLVKESGNL